MLRAASGAGLEDLFPRRFEKENAMADPTKRNDENGHKPTSSDDADLSARLKSLDARIEKVSAQHAEAKESQTRPASDTSAVGQAFRLSAEFVSGVIAGGIIGFIVDRLFATSPWGLVICVILGFCAGMFNLLRAAGLMKPSRHDQKR
ncbi:AtpZ/AtpI family protein [Microvirga sp. 2MCAF38]|uniref:AtpZ/AtpI family protein n=1 Tax=Microvirga sp. 2MCAF38 TaxID=3232989 RepID=UPI003F9ABCA6